MPHLSLSFFGAFQATLDGNPILHFRSANARALLVYLVMQPERSFTREQLATLIWPYLDDSAAKKSLRQTLYQLRRVLGDSDQSPTPFLLVTQQSVQWNTASDYALDVKSFLQRVEMETAVFDNLDPFLLGFVSESEVYENWLRIARERLQRIALEKLHKLTIAALAKQQFSQAQTYAQKQLALEPWRESAQQQLMRAYALAGDRTAALAQYESCVVTLTDELGVEPTAETVDLYEAIASGKIAPTAKLAIPAKAPQAAQPTAPPLPHTDRASEEVLLQKVYRFWIEGVYEQALADGFFLDLALRTVPKAVANPWERMVPPANSDGSLIPSETPLHEIFAENGRSLLILGEPGAGKTVLLLTLAKSLLAAANANVHEPLPVVLNLATWATTSTRSQQLTNWLVDELNEKYLIPRRLAESWVENGRLALLLDGLDEIETSKRAACIAAINDFRLQNGLTPIVICCRLQPYLDTDAQLRVGGAIAIQPLTTAQSSHYLRQLGATAETLQQAIEADPVLQEIAQSPLMLQVMSKVFREGGSLILETNESTGTQRKQLLLHIIFENYVQQRIQQLAATTSYQAEEALSWLSWLANKLSAQNQSLFLLERLQPSWLASRKQRWRYLVLTRLTMGFLVGLLSWLFGRIGVEVEIAQHTRSSLLLIQYIALPLALIDLIIALSIHVIYGFSVAGVDWLFFERRHGQERPFSPWDWTRKIAMVLVVAFLTTAQLLFFGEVLDLLILQVAASSFLFFLVSHFAFGQAYNNDIGTVEALSWSWRASLRGWPLVVFTELLLTFVIWQLYDDAALSLLQVVILTSPMALLMFILSGLTNSYVEIKSRPNQGIWLSGRNALIGSGSTFVAMLILSALSRFILELQGISFITPLYNVYGSTIAGLIAGFVFGGFNVVNHAYLRLLLRLSQQTPEPFPQFLQVATRHILLYRVGGGFIFIHRLLQEHLAAKTDPTPPPNLPKRTILATPQQQPKKQPAT
ncbi:MAG: BTAD domain-containing putative transcriptional regulator [Chloroflexota bacterium]